MTTALPPVGAQRAQELMDLEKKYLLQNYARYPLALARGKGCWVYDLEGRRYLDMMAGIGVNALGHAHPRITRVIRQQADRKSTRLNSSHLGISYAVFCLKKKKKITIILPRAHTVQHNQLHAAPTIIQ